MERAHKELPDVVRVDVAVSNPVHHPATARTALDVHPAHRAVHGQVLVPVPLFYFASTYWRRMSTYE